MTPLKTASAGRTDGYLLMKRVQSSAPILRRMCSEQCEHGYCMNLIVETPANASKGMVLCAVSILGYLVGRTIKGEEGNLEVAEGYSLPPPFGSGAGGSRRFRDEFS